MSAGLLMALVYWSIRLDKVVRMLRIGLQADDAAFVVRWPGEFLRQFAIAIDCEWEATGSLQTGAPKKILIKPLFNFFQTYGIKKISYHAQSDKVAIYPLKPGLLDKNSHRELEKALGILIELQV